MSEPKNKPRGAAATKENQANYAKELAKLEASGKKFKPNQYGEVSVGWFAEKCGFSTWVLTDGALKERFAIDVKRIGVELKEANDADVAARLQKKSEDKTKESNELRRQLELKINEIERLQKQVADLEKRNRELLHGRVEQERSLEHLLATGERFLL
jgi:hypothetical protein